MFDANTYLIAGTFTASTVAAAIAVFWAHRREKAAERDADHYKEKWTKMWERAVKMEALASRLTDVSVARGDRIVRALAQAKEHPNTRPGKIIDILMGEEPSQ